MRKAGWITLLYGLLILVGGVFGHIKAASTASLIMGTVFGIALIASGIGMFKNHLLPTYAGIIFTLILIAFFLYRYLFTMKFMPAGLLCLISIAVFTINLLLVRNQLRKERKK